MKAFITFILSFYSCFILAQRDSDKTQIEATLNTYIDGFYQGDTTKLKAALKPRLYKFGYLKNKDTGTYSYYEHLSFANALKLAQKLKDQGRLRTETEMRSVKVLEISDHIAAAKVTASWGIDYVLLSKDNGKWMIEEVIWEGPYQEKYKSNSKTTTYYLIRHAEKVTDDPMDKNPHLSTLGNQRATRWKNSLSSLKFDKVYATNYFRTKETAAPIASINNLDITMFNPKTMNVEAFKNENLGQNVLVVGHSNTTPLLANALLGENKYQTINEDNYANLYIITITHADSNAVLLKLE